MTLPLAVAQIRPVKADPDATLERVEEVFRRAHAGEPRPRLLLFPETSLTGYFLEGGVVECALHARELFRRLDERYRAATGGEETLEVTVGFYERRQGDVFNAALHARLGGSRPELVHVHRKVFLPTYGVFEEARYVEAGSSFAAFDTAWGRAGVLICEDAWHSLSAALAALDGARLLLVPSASPAHGVRPGPGEPASVARWHRILKASAEEHGVFVAYAGLAGFEGGKGLPGASAVYGPGGELLARAPLWEETLLTATLDPEQQMAARSRSPLLADLEAALPRILAASPATRGLVGDGSSTKARGSGEGDGGTDAPGGPAGDGDGREGEAGRREGEAGRREGGVEGPRRESSREGGHAGAGPGQAASRPLAPGLPPTAGGGGTPGPDPEDRTPLAIDAELVETWLVEFLRQEVRDRRGFRRAVLGLSGGVDSALAATLSARALGADAVHAFLLPSRISSQRGLEDARSLADRLGVETHTVPIDDAVDGYLEEHEPDAGALRRGNVMARQRMIVLFDQSKKLDALPVGTGNKSERLLGYFTWHADDAPPVNPLGDLFKTQVWALARHVGVPARIVQKTPSAELVEGQTDEDELGLAYEDADLILHWLVRGYRPEGLVERGFDRPKVERVHELLQGSHFKRHLPTVAMLTDTAVGQGYLRPVDFGASG